MNNNEEYQAGLGELEKLMAKEDCLLTDADLYRMNELAVAVENYERKNIVKD